MMRGEENEMQIYEIHEVRAGVRYEDAEGILWTGVRDGAVRIDDDGSGKPGGTWDDRDHTDPVMCWGPFEVIE